jgi:hypothetical protein
MALRFTRTAKLGAADGTEMLLVPIQIIFGTQTVGGEAVVLKQDVTVEPSFLCLAISVE